MKIQRYQELAKSGTLLIADKDLLLLLLKTGNLETFSGIYENVCVTEEVYQTAVKSLEIDRLKEFSKSVDKKKVFASRPAILSVMEQSKILTEEEAIALLGGMSEKYDVLLDDPRKSRIFQAYGVHALRPSDIITSAACTRRGEL